MIWFWVSVLILSPFLSDGDWEYNINLGRGDV
nr:MAG TPA: hypothetical protein [Caudoviricetes sp.]